jgi:hypothetical protein
MKKLIILTTSFVFLLVFILPFAAAFLIKIIPANDQPSYDINNKRGIFGINEVSQQFTSQEDNLTAIGLSLGNPNLKNKKEIIFYLTDTNGNEVRKVIISGANVQDGDLIKFNFDPISVSKNVTYIFRLSSSSAGPEETLTVPFSTIKTSWIGPANYGEEVIENGLPIVTYHKPASHLLVVRQILTSWLSRI